MSVCTHHYIYQHAHISLCQARSLIFISVYVFDLSRSVYFLGHLLLRFLLLLRLLLRVAYKLLWGKEGGGGERERERNKYTHVHAGVCTVCAHAHPTTHTCTHVHTCTHIHVSMHTHTYINTHTHIYACTNTYIHTSLVFLIRSDERVGTVFRFGFNPLPDSLSEVCIIATRALLKPKLSNTAMFLCTRFSLSFS